MPARVRITDVAPRDGLQNEAGTISAADKVRLVDALSRSGVDEIEVSSFVSPRWVPQLGDAAEVFAGLSPRDGVTYSALVPNERGLQSALDARAASLARHGRPLPDKLAVFTAASQTFSQRNTNATIEQTIERFRPIAAACGALPGRLPLRGYVSCAVACPFEGPIAPAAVARVVELLLALGVDEVDLGDTIGAGTPETIATLLEQILPIVPSRDPFGTRGPSLTLHLHDTFGGAQACVRQAIRMGVASFDSSAGGLGGCPYASTPERRAPGNVSTHTLVNAIQEAGGTSGVSRDQLSQAAEIAALVVRRSAGPAGGAA